MDSELLKWGIQEGALVVVVLLLIFYIRKRDEDVKHLVECNNAALEENAKSNNEISRVIDKQTDTLQAQSDALQVLLYGIKRNKTNLSRLRRSSEDS